MLRLNSLRQRLQAGESVRGVLAALGSSVVAEIIGQSGCDFVIVDGEHGLGGREMQLHCLQAIAATPATAIVRVAAGDPVNIKRALDMGAEAIMVPDVRSAAQARDIVAACRYPPRGIRGFAAPLIRASDFGLRSHAYLARCEDELLIIPMIESAEGARAAGEIAAVDGIDVVQFGPFDLAYDLGVHGVVDDPRVVAVTREAEKAITAAGKPIGALAPAGTDTGALRARGYRFFTIANDAQLLVAGLQSALYGAVPPLAPHYERN